MLILKTSKEVLLVFLKLGLVSYCPKNNLNRRIKIEPVTVFVCRDRTQTGGQIFYLILIN